MGTKGVLFALGLAVPDSTDDVSCTHVQATWAVVKAAVPLLKQLAGGKLHAASPAVAPELCRALSCLCCRTSPCGRAFAGHIFKECASDLHL